MPNPYDLTTHDGKTVDWLTHAALLKAEKILGYELSITQGSYNKGGVAASGGTHDGGGVIDLAPFEAARKERVLRSIGFAAYDRPELWREGRRIWGRHVHAVLIGNQKLSDEAKDQVAEYLAGGDGLKGDAPDTGPREFVNRRFTWPKPTRVERARAELVLAHQRAVANGWTGRARAIKAALALLPKR